ncbi:MAG: hypothetical protein IJD06_10080 [Clostridia bacterium]|nr:hypothetical protein [Clostridia bacterium]
MENISIAGAGKIAGGMEYGKVSIAGSGSITDSIRCEGLSCSGSGHAHGSLDCSGRISASGSFRCDGDIRTKELKAAGAFTAEGDVQADLLSVAGSVRIGGDLHGEEIRGAGSLTVGKDAEAERVDLRGSIHIVGLLNAEQIEIYPARTDSEIGSLGGACIRIHRWEVQENHRLSSFIRLLRGEDASGGVVRTEVIEGDELDLDSVEADTVRGRRVHIRSGARIRHLEYSETCEVEEGAQIGETVRVE